MISAAKQGYTDNTSDLGHDQMGRKAPLGFSPFFLHPGHTPADFHQPAPISYTKRV